jgi:carbon-monoxide dehydrogenase small subunit
MTQRTIKLQVNGQPREGQADPRKLLVDFLREDLALTGTHAGCEHGVCGACTVIVNGEAVRSCLLFAVQANDAEISTVEGLASGERLHALQQAFHEEHALQCGFCTPGILMSMAAFLAEFPQPSEQQIRVALSGNLCRCTGYQNIVRAVAIAAARIAEAK